MGGAGQRDDQNVIVPQTGAGPYWYVDPRATGVPTPSNSKPFDPMQGWDEQGHTDDITSDHRKALRMSDSGDIVHRNDRGYMIGTDAVLRRLLMGTEYQRTQMSPEEIRAFIDALTRVTPYTVPDATQFRF